MGRDTNISWTKSTLNTAWGCTKVTSECDKCYMFRLSRRWGIDPEKVKIRYGAQPEARAFLMVKINSLNNIIFVNSMSDTFHRDIPDSVLDMWFSVFSEFPKKTFQILTKRPARMKNYFESRKVPPNCWLGTSVGIRKTVGRISILRSIAAPVKFVSFEPLLEDLGTLDLNGIHWALIGGESDVVAPRPMKPEWAESLVDQCRQQNVAVWFKQNGGVGGDGAGGDLLNGRKIQEWPTPTRTPDPDEYQDDQGYTG